MAIPPDMAVLEQRWQALDQALKIHEAWLDDQASTSPRTRTLWCLVRRLRAFANTHFTYFYDGFSPGGTLEKSPLYPPKHVLSTILYQIADDLDVYRRAAADELVASEPLVRNALNRGDRLVLEALKPAVGLGLENFKSITYFQRTAAIRVIPYDLDAMAVIGIPFTCAEVYQDFLAIPHEVGHFVFWNGRVKGGRLWVKLREAVLEADGPRWILPWLEEIFADVYGALVAGPVIGLSFQDLQLTESAVRFIKDDGHHPAPAVRPEVYAAALEKAGLEQWNGRLRARWQEKVTEEFKNPSYIFLQRPPLSGFLSGVVDSVIDVFGYDRVPVAAARQAERAVVNVCYEFLKELDFTGNWWGEFTYGPSAPSPERTKEVDDLFAIFTDYLLGLDRNGDEQFGDLKCSTDGIWESWRNGLTPASGGMLPRGGRTAINLPWIPIWIADGWSTKGPHAFWP